MWAFALALIPAFISTTIDTYLPVPFAQIDQAVLIGRRDGAVDKYLGIKFADAPRFRLPIPVASYHGYVNARSYGAACPQQLMSPLAMEFPAPALPESESEDCLTVNVIVPKGTKSSDKLPVAVYIYGGAFQIGYSKEYDPFAIQHITRSIELGMPIIQVTIGYRVSAYGFLAGKQLQAEGVSNFGLHDQREGLRWVNKYIHAFGGDPSRVTINGASAGAISVTYQMLAFGGNHENLFQAVFAQSGAIFPSPPMEKGQVHYDTLISHAGCANATDTLDCIRAVHINTLQAAVNKMPDIFGYQGGAVVWKPSVDGNIVQDSPYRLLSDGKVARVPLVTGTMDDEGTVFSIQHLNHTTDDHFEEWVQKYWFPGASAKQLEKLWTSYPSSASEGSPFGTGESNQLYPQFKRMAAFQGDALFQAPRRVLTQGLAQNGEHNLWTYLSKRGKNFPHLGCFHGSDVFTGFLDDYFINFVNNHDPNTGKGLKWPEYTKDRRELYTFNDDGDAYLSEDNYRSDAIEDLTNLFRSYPLI